MKKRSYIAIIAAAALALAGSLPRASAEVIDRIVATVNGSIILQSDWDEALCLQALLNNRPLDQFSSDERRAVLDQLIDQELLREQTSSSNFNHASDSEVATRVAEARKQYPQAGSDDAWRSLLAKYHLGEKDLAEHVRREIDLMRLVDSRLRPAVQIDSKSVEAYYRDQFVPKLKETGAAEVPLAEVSTKIRELLTEQKVSELLVSWLHTLRTEGNVRLPGVSPPASGPEIESR
ncbi:MAG TPA: SurA N-terminal domain-containing protein [Candidatus Binatia bacterium]|nr:SurA N-terminal domain-containing protein [Candidatus Binatia bacterium]